MFVNKKHNMKEKTGREKKGKGPSATYNDNHDPQRCLEAIRAGSRCWAHFSSEVNNGRDLFRIINYAEISEEAKTVQCNKRGGAFSKVLAKRWSEADKDEWDRKAREMDNIFE